MKAKEFKPCTNQTCDCYAKDDTNNCEVFERICKEEQERQEYQKGVLNNAKSNNRDKV